LDTGRPVTNLIDEDLTAEEQTSVIRSARERAYNRINSKLRGKTAVPAFHIPELKQVEIDFCLSDLMMGAFSGSTLNESDWGTKYEERANSVLDNLVFEASAEEPVTYGENSGNGKLKFVDVFSDFIKSEVWAFTALTATEFSVVGSVTGQFPNLTVDVQYPEKDWTDDLRSDYGLTLSSYPTVSRTPFICIIKAGSSPFEQGDNFKVRTFSSSADKRQITTGKLVRA
jgi:hypothetical protein